MPAKNPSRVIYGVLAIGALLAAESGAHESYLDTLASAVIATLLYWLAHSYADLLGHRLQTAERLTASALAHALRDEAALLNGAAVPILALVVAWIAGASQQTAVAIAVWSSIAALVVFELLAAVRSRATPRELALEMSVGLTLGLAILFLKVVLH
jgi:hypothetical protein